MKVLKNVMLISTGGTISGQIASYHKEDKNTSNPEELIKIIDFTS